MSPNIILNQFEIEGGVVELQTMGVGHINDTFLVRMDGGRRYVMQRINQKVFADVDGLMGNVIQVSEHLRGKGVATLRFVCCRAGGFVHRDEEADGAWRVMDFVEDTRAVAVVESATQAEAAAFAYGEFSNALSDFPADRLVETLPDFHHMQKRIEAFEAILAADPMNRAAGVAVEIDAVMAAMERLADVVAAKLSEAVPLRIAHNDAKLENVLFDEMGERAVCVVDLDTVMPGSWLDDFGDLVRSAAATAGEGELDLGRVEVSLDRYAALARGFVRASGEAMAEIEKSLLPYAGKIITFEQALRFLGDYVDGDRYYGARYQTQNLDRARNQLAMLSSLERKERELERIVVRCW